MVRPAAPRTPRLDRCTEPVAEKLRVGVLRELEDLHRRVTELTAIVNDIDVTIGNAPIGASYVTATVSGALTDERVLTAGTNITIDNTTPGQAIVNASAGAPTNAQYVCLATHASLSAERVLTEGNGIDITDGGANGNVTIAVDESELAMQAPSYVTLANTASLPNERALTAGHGVDIVDAGAGSTVTIDVDESELDGTLLGGVSSVVDVQATDLQVSSTSHRDIYVYAIPAGTFTTGDVMRVVWNGHYFNNDGANRSMNFIISLGGVDIWQEVTATQTASATRRWLRIEFDVAIQSDTLHIANVEGRFGTATAATIGVGDLGANGQIFGGGESIDSTVDLSAAQTLRIQVAIAPAITNSANIYVRRRCAYTERLRA
jgi:hypothetical protein